MTNQEEKTLYSNCCQYALKYISRYPKTEKELTIKLQQKGYNSDEIRYTMDYLKSKNFVDDRLFVETYIRSELVNKGKPIINITNKLYQKGVDTGLVNQMIREYQDDILTGIYQKIEKEIETYKRKGVEGFDIIHKIMRKGYKLDDIKRVIENKNK